MKVIAVVVTYNRKVLLLECINALLSQTYPVDTIVVIDNHSTDNSLEFIAENVKSERIKTVRLNKNYGGSGGFFYGMKKACENNPDYIWVMDDDTIPQKDSLENLMNTEELLKGKFSFLASKAYGLNHEPMNIPFIDLSESANCYEYLADGLVKISVATFVSLLIKKEAVEKEGLPHRFFFIWGDDLEYTNRLTKYYGPGYFCGKSVVLHKRQGNNALSPIDEDNVNRLKIFHYFYRNKLVYLKAYGSKKTLCRFKIEMFLSIFVVLLKKKHKMRKIHNIFKGYFGYIFGTYNRKAFKKRFTNDADLIEYEDNEKNS